MIHQYNISGVWTVLLNITLLTAVQQQTQGMSYTWECLHTIKVMFIGTARSPAPDLTENTCMVVRYGVGWLSADNVSELLIWTTTGVWVILEKRRACLVFLNSQAWGVRAECWGFWNKKSFCSLTQGLLKLLDTLTKSTKVKCSSLTFHNYPHN